MCDMLLTTHFTTLILLTVWRFPIIVPIAFYAVFGILEALFLSSTATKVPQGRSAHPSLQAADNYVTHRANLHSELLSQDVACLPSTELMRKLLSASVLSYRQEVNVTKCHAGGWFSILIAGIVGGMMLLWVWGNKQKNLFLQRGGNLPLTSFITVQDPHKRDDEGKHVNQLMLKGSETLLSRCSGVPR